MAPYLAFAALVAVVLAVYVWYLTAAARRRRRALRRPFPAAWRTFLQERVRFYATLPNEEQQKFEQRVQLFLATTRVEGLQTDVDDEVRLLVAASAVIPLFGFDDWEYPHLGEVLIVPGAVRPEDDRQDFGVGTVTGQVRPFQRRYYVKLSKGALEAGFRRSSDGHNVGVHEFAHLIDQADGAVDGQPEAFLSPALLRTWTQLMHQLMGEIKRGKSDLDGYAATGEQEFFAVATEYFFEKPNALAEHHPELYRLLTQVFHQNPRRRMKR